MPNWPSRNAGGIFKVVSRKQSKAVIGPLLALLAACGGGFERGAPIPDADGIALRLREATGAAGPTHVVFQWEYADERGNFRGDGSARVNPPDLFRLDLFGSGEGAMQVTLVGGELATTGDLEDIELPTSVFLYAMAGVFRPGPGAPLAAFRSRDLEVLEYGGGQGTNRYFFVSGDRLSRVEERRDGRLERRIEIEWGADPTWPLEAWYRDNIARNGVRWELESSNAQRDSYDASIYVLPKNR